MSHKGTREFYRTVLRRLIAEGVVGADSRLLVVCAGEADRDVLSSLGFANVVLSGLDPRMSESAPATFSPYSWHCQDVEALSYPDGSFDLVVVHSGLHHLTCPWKGIQEMYRVASTGLLAFEPYLSPLTWLGAKLGVGQTYEDGAVTYHDGQGGGLAETEIPNYEYRFTRREVVKTIQTLAPVAEHECTFWFTTRVPGRLFRLKQQKAVQWVVKSLTGALVFLGSAFPVFANNFAFYVRKPRLPDELFPWLTMENGVIRANREYSWAKYDRSKPGRGR